MIKNKLAIILVNWNQYELTRSCILSILNCDYKNLKIIVVDNNSEDKSVDLLKSEFDYVNLIQNQSNLGFTGANNIGISMARDLGFEFIMLLNNDTEVENSFIEPLLERFELEKDLGAIQPLILNFYERDIVWNYGGKFNRFFGNPVTLYKNFRKDNLIKSKYTDWITGCCFVFRSRLIDQIGYLDDDYFVYYEDVDYSIKITNAGYKLGLEKNSIIFHHEGKSWIQKKSSEGSVSSKTHYLSIRNHIFFLKKNRIKFNILGIFFYQFLKIFSYSLYFILRLRFVKLVMVYKGLIDGIKYKNL